jgi:hypothetical protein
MRNAATPMTRRSFAITRLLPSLAVALLARGTLVPNADASKKGKNSKKARQQRVDNYRKNICEAGGGTMEVTEERPGGTTTLCTGGLFDGEECVHTSKTTRCYSELIDAPDTNAGGGGAVPPSNGGNEDPTSGGGADPGAGGGVDPGPGADPNPSDDGGGIILTSYDGGKHHEAKHYRKRKHHRHGERHR